MELKNKIFLLVYTAIWVVLVVHLGSQVREYKQALDQLQFAQNLVVMRMDESCYTQFTNNYDKALYIKMRFEE